MVAYCSDRTADTARKPVRGSLRLAASAITVAMAIASSPALADGKHRGGRYKSASFGPVVPQITTGVGNSNKQTDFVVVSIPAATGKTVGDGGPGPSALPVTAIGNGAGAGLRPVGAAGKDTGVPLISSANGQLWLAAGQSVEIADPGSPDLRVVVTAPRHQSLDIGKIVANTRRSGIYAALAARAGPPRANGVKLASDGRVILTSTGKRGHGFKSNHWHERRTGGKRSQVPVAAGSGSEESDLNVNPAPVQGGISLAVNQQTDADRDATLKTGDPVIDNTAKPDSNKSRPSVCS